jgi:hypothetical protein
VIDKPVVRVEDRRFRRHLHLRLRGERVLWIAQRRELVPIFAFMLADFFSGSALARVDQPERDLGRVVRADLLNQRRITVGVPKVFPKLPEKDRPESRRDAAPTFEGQAKRAKRKREVPQPRETARSPVIARRR